MGLHMLVSLPLSFYSGYVVEHQFGLSNQTVRRWFRNWALSNSLALGLGRGVIRGLVFGSCGTPAPTGGSIAAGAFFVVSVLLGQLAPVLIVPLFYKVEPIDNAELVDRMKRLGRWHGPDDRRRLPFGPERRHIEGERDAGRPRPHAPRADGRHAAGQVHARRDRSHLRARDRPSRAPPHSEDDCHGAGLQPGRLLAARSRARVVGRHPDRGRSRPRAACRS